MLIRSACSFALFITAACASDSADIGKTETVVVSAFPVVGPEGGWGPDRVQLAAFYADYTHRYFCEAELIVRTEADPSCPEGKQDCSSTLQRAVEVKRTTCAEPGTPFTLRRVAMLGAGAVGGAKDLREDPLSGSCEAGFQLGRGTEHPFAVRFAEVAACERFVAAIQHEVTLTVDFVTVDENTIQLVGSKEEEP